MDDTTRADLDMFIMGFRWKMTPIGEHAYMNPVHATTYEEVVAERNDPLVTGMKFKIDELEFSDDLGQCRVPGCDSSGKMGKHPFTDVVRWSEPTLAIRGKARVAVCDICVKRNR